MENTTIKLESYSHPEFYVCGYKYRVNYETLDSQMKEIWGDQKKMESLKGIDQTGLEEKDNSLYAVYFNKDAQGFDMIVGLTCKANVIQKDIFTTLTVPEQNYKYHVFDFTGPASVAEGWKKINSLPDTILHRTFGYDLEMYGKDMKTFTIAVSV